MPSNTTKTKLIRSNKDKLNKRNIKADQKRIQKNAEILKELASEE